MRKAESDHQMRMDIIKQNYSIAHELIQWIDDNANKLNKDQLPSLGGICENTSAPPPPFVQQRIQSIQDHINRCTESITAFHTVLGKSKSELLSKVKMHACMHSHNSCNTIIILVVSLMHTFSIRRYLFLLLLYLLPRLFYLYHLLFLYPYCHHHHQQQQKTSHCQQRHHRHLIRTKDVHQ